jgi:hypothetical protein
MNKRADGERILWTALARLPYLALIFIIFVYINNNLTVQGLNSNKIDQEIITNRIINSALVYTDPYTKRPYPGIIDFEKAEQEYFNRHFELENEQKMAAKVEISLLSGEVIKEVYMNEKWYERWNPYSSFEKYEKSISKKNIIIFREEKFVPGIIKIHVIAP